MALSFEEKMDKEKFQDSAVSQIKSFFESERWQYVYDDGQEKFSFELIIDCPLRILSFEIVIEESCILLYSTIPIGVNIDDLDMINMMSKYVCDVNFQSKEDGSLEFNTNKGIIIYKNILVLENKETIVSIKLRETIYEVVSIIENYSDAIIGISLGRCNDKNAFDNNHENSNCNIYLIEGMPTYSVKTLLSNCINELLNMPNESSDEE